MGLERPPIELPGGRPNGVRPGDLNASGPLTAASVRSMRVVRRDFSSPWLRAAGMVLLRAAGRYESGPPQGWPLRESEWPGEADESTLARIATSMIARHEREQRGHAGERG